MRPIAVEIVADRVDSDPQVAPVPLDPAANRLDRRLRRSTGDGDPVLSPPQCGRQRQGGDNERGSHAEVSERRPAVRLEIELEPIDVTGRGLRPQVNCQFAAGLRISPDLLPGLPLIKGNGCPQSIRPVGAPGAPDQRIGENVRAGDPVEQSRVPLRVNRPQHQAIAKGRQGEVLQLAGSGLAPGLVEDRSVAEIGGSWRDGSLAVAVN